MAKGPSIDKSLQIQDSLKSVAGYDEVFQLLPRTSYANASPEVGLFEQGQRNQGQKFDQEILLT